MLLVFIDIFSKWVELIPLKKAIAAQLEFGFRERIRSRFGAPRRLICDNGTQFQSQSFRALFNWNTAFRTPPQQNPKERANRTIKTIIAQYVNQDHRTRGQLVPEISLGINTSISDSTRFSPAYLVQGREHRLPGFRKRSAPPWNQPNSFSGTKSTLQPEATFKVVKFLSSNIVRLQQVDGRKRRTAGIGDLKEYHPREEQYDDSIEDPRRSDSQPTLDNEPDTTLPG
ncbi:uncharacterized protein LOC128265216 [Drosophila gunungcola]|uniref:uncharacterized protein LOC128265216 n=1 Tax=Drosophila gunungcola TaxID=103775 RepID=UPI0022E28539|nr:uncharacterized protein LOC128265216 [Drosophila gunungcola]